MRALACGVGMPRRRGELMVPSQVVMASEQQQNCYGDVGAEQAASTTAGVSAYTDSIREQREFIYYFAITCSFSDSPTILEATFNSISNL
jgi:hypothetical protein